MGIWVKTTVEIAPALLTAAKKRAVRDGTTLRALIEEGLRRVLAAEQGRKKKFRLRDGSFRGKGLQPGITSFEQMLELAYEGRGG